MTYAFPPARKPDGISWTQRGLLLLILLLAGALRIRGIGFGLPALNDPDEPLFMMKAVEMLRNHSLNPGWFGHPATITLYCLALISLAVGGIGVATGRYADADAFVSAVYADPAILFLPARLFFAACGVACVYLTWRLGRRIGGAPAGLVAAALLAVNAIHIDYSQVIRTDVQASLFMLLCLLATVAIAEHGRMRDYLLAGVFVGLGCATKWPAAVIALGPVSAGLWRMRAGHREAGKLVGFAGAAVAALFLASPYLLFDYRTVVANLSGEARPMHLGATGDGLLANLDWYVREPLLSSFGAVALVLAALGGVLLPLRDRAAAVALLPGIVGFCLLIGVQALRWERWLVPLLPLVAILAGYALTALAETLEPRIGEGARFLPFVATVALMIPMLAAAEAHAAERANDTRQLASEWVRDHVPPGRSILVEHAALDLISGPWKILFPLGSVGCVDARAMLSARVRYAEVEKLRSTSPIVDLASVDLSRIAGCRADYVILTHYDRYRDAPAQFAPEFRRYAMLTEASVLRLVVAPKEGQRGGPKVYIYQGR